MNGTPDDLINGYLDDALTEPQHAALAEWLNADPANARRFAEAVMLHERLATELAVDMPAAATFAIEPKPDRRSERPSATGFAARWLRLRPTITVVVTTCLVLLVVAAFWPGVGQTPVAAATVELDRIAAAARQPVDRTYQVTAVDIGGRRRPATAPAGRDIKPSIDGATIHLRGPSSYVLIRHDDEGSTMVNGSDGVQSWVVPPRGRVRVSSDVQRFRASVIGNEDAIPFIDLRESLERVQTSYTLSIVEEPKPEFPGLKRLEATRLDAALGGPKRAIIWYAPETGIIHRMLLDRLPQAKGGPSTVVLELVSQRDLGAAFYQHGSHHDPDRPVVQE